MKTGSMRSFMCHTLRGALKGCRIQKSKISDSLT